MMPSLQVRFCLCFLEFAGILQVFADILEGRRVEKENVDIASSKNSGVIKLAW